MQKDKYTQREYDLMFTLDVPAYVRKHNQSASPDNQISGDPDWLRQWDSAYELEKWRAAHLLAEINSRVNPPSRIPGEGNIKWWVENLTLSEIEESILHAEDLFAEMEMIREELARNKETRDAAAQEIAERLRMERVFLGLEPPRDDDNLPEWIRLEIEAEDLGWQAKTGDSRRRKNGKQSL